MWLFRVLLRLQKKKKNLRPLYTKFQNLFHSPLIKSRVSVFPAPILDTTLNILTVKNEFWKNAHWSTKWPPLKKKKLLGVSWWHMLWYGFHPWPRTFYMLLIHQKKTKNTHTSDNSSWIWLHHHSHETEMLQNSWENYYISDSLPCPWVFPVIFPFVLYPLSSPATKFEQKTATGT